MSLEGLQERLSALQETTAQLRQLIDRLADLKFQPGTVPLDAEEEDTVSGELSAEISHTLRGGTEEQELLREEAKYVRLDTHEKQRLEEGVERVGTELVSCRYAFRRARLSAKKSLEKARRLERELLLQSFSAPLSGATSPQDGPAGAEHDESHQRARAPRYGYQERSHLSDKDRQTVGASSNVTDALRRTHELIAAEVSRSEFAHQTLTESSNALKQLNESYGSLDTMLSSSRDLLSTLLRSQKSDTWYLQTSLYMLLVTAGWLVFRRLLYYPTWWLVLMPLRLVFGLGTRAGSAIISSSSSASQQDAGEESGVAGAGAGAGGRATVEGLPDADLPTVGVESVQVSADPDSMIDKVARMVDAANEAVGEGGLPEEGQPEEEKPRERNTKKRMHEETFTAKPEEVPREEL